MNPFKVSAIHQGPQEGFSERSCVNCKLTSYLVFIKSSDILDAADTNGERKQVAGFLIFFTYQPVQMGGLWDCS